MRNIVFFLLISCIVMIVLYSCEVDHGLKPETYKIKGKILFAHGEPPENTGRIEVFAIKEFPPQDPQNFLYLSRSGPLNFNAGNQISYEILVSPTDYDLVGLVWREKDKDWDLTGLMGFYTGEGSSLLPVTVEVSKEERIASDINIYAIWDRVSKDTKIRGNITYEGEWPEDTQLLLLAIYTIAPTSEIGYLLFENVDYTQSLFVESSDYELAVNTGVYNYIVLYWIGKNISDLSDLIVLGVYENPSTPGQPGTIDVRSGEEADHVDIHVNFESIDFSGNE
ncbi:hypothetical protein JXB12_08580 [candidate division KSB1 bacterium]|nr:hypothetical protein [candidate division KSB1 bacterium]